MSKRIIFNVLHKIAVLMIVFLWAGCSYMDTQMAVAKPDSMKRLSTEKALDKTKTDTTSLTEAQKQAVLDSYGKLPMYFIENRGQTDSKVEFYVNQPGQNIFFTPQALHLKLTQNKEGDKKAHGLRIDLVNADPEGRIKSIKRSSAKINIFKGKKEEWKTDIPTSSEIAYTGPWPGVRLHYQGKQSKLESVFHVAPGTDPSVIRMRYSGQDKISLDEKGNLVVKTSVGKVSESAPYMYQEIDGRRVPVEGAFRLKDDTVSFSIASYNPGYTLIIDPVIIYAGYIGGNDIDEGHGIAVDNSGNAYITGRTFSSEATFPVTVGPDLTFNGGSNDAFVAKISPSGTGLVYAGYIGGNDIDEGHGIAVDNSGNAYITGRTFSSEATFPVTVGPDLTHNGTFDAFVAKVNPGGTSLVYAGYIGGNSADEGHGIAVDGSGNAYITGKANSDEATFPVTVGPDLTHNGFDDAFVAKVNPGGTSLVYAGYIGGNGYDEGHGIAVDGGGNAYITGDTSSTETTFPVTVGPDLTHNGFDDGFVAKVNPGGTSLVYAGYIGGSGNDYSNGIAVDGGGNAYITGDTNSNETTFPVTVGPDLTYNTSGDAFVAKVNPSGTGLVYAGYIGGGILDYGNDIAVDGSGNAYITGYTQSSEATFPVLVGPDLTINGVPDAFVAKVNPFGTSLIYAGYIGGSSSDDGIGIAVDSSGNAYITGRTWSDETTFPVAVGPDLTHNGRNDIFVAKIVCTMTFSDVSGHWAGNYINAIFCAGITTGFPDNTYKPENQVTRAQTAAFIIRALYGESFSYSGTPYFPDVSSGHWAFKYVQRLFEDGITTGFPDGTYGPESVVTRAQMAAFLIRALYGESFSYGSTPYFPDVPGSHWAFKYVQRLSEDGITTGFPDGTYGPESIVTRAQMAAFLARAFLGMP